MYKSLYAWSESAWYLLERGVSDGMQHGAHHAASIIATELAHMQGRLLHCVRLCQLLTKVLLDAIAAE